MTKIKHVLRGCSLWLLLISLCACSVMAAHELNTRYGTAQTRARMVDHDSNAGRRFQRDIQPILDSRCVACHACYDAPCQLKLNSAAGIDRGITEVPVYSGKRLIAAEPTRLFIDYATTEQWRQNGFHPVLNERQQTPQANLAGSLLFQMLKLKEKHPLPDSRTLDEDDFDFSLKRDNQCPSVEEFDDYAHSNPRAGMPYGFPGLDSEKMQTLVHWLEDGAPLAQPPPLSNAQQQQIKVWETFFNQSDTRGRLVSRYIYEHLFLANLYFPALQEKPQDRLYYKLVRSRTAPGEPIDVIATRRPAQSPGATDFYYRLQPRYASRVTKTHLPYALDPKRMNWFDTLFFKPDYKVSKLPGYTADDANPFRTFQAIPANSRYRFLLEEAHYYIAGFIKGPVCRGPVAVDVINDQFWVFFINPDAQALPMLDGFLEQQSPNLRLPGEQGSNAGLLSYWTIYSDLHRNYLKAKSEGLKRIFAENPLNLDIIWDGDGNNSNATLTVFRNFDDAAVVKGLLGNPPKTAWVVDYPLLERIHYLLTADFDVYGNVGHQLNTRLYMDFLRIEGEYNFLSLLPSEARIRERDFWYRESSKRLHDQLYSYDLPNLKEPDIDYGDADPKSELYAMLRRKLAAVIDDQYSLDNRSANTRQTRLLKKLQKIKGKPASLLAETTILLVEDDKGRGTLYTLLANRAHLNITSLLMEKSNRLPKEDSITVAYGILGDYPNTFLRVREVRLASMIDHIASMETKRDYRRLLDQYGIRRTNPDFWKHSDRLHELFLQQQPEQAGWLDYNRFENR